MLKRNRGFTFIELSISLFLMSIIAISMVAISNAVSTYNKKKLTEQKLNKIEQAISIFLTNNERLPCPASLLLDDSQSTFGVEDTSFGAGITESGTSNKLAYGQVPTKTLNLSDEYAFDGWGNKISYAVQDDFASTTTDNFEKTHYDTAQIIIKSDGVSGENVTTDAIYVLISHGENGYGAYNSSGSQIPISGSGAGYNAELTNIISAGTFDDTFVQDLYNTDFDDIVRHKTKKQAIYSAGWEGIKCLGDSAISGYSGYSDTLFSEDEVIYGAVCSTDTYSLNPADTNKPQKICGRYGEWSEEMYPCQGGCQVSITNPSPETKNILDGQQIQEECPTGEIGRIVHTCSGTTVTPTDECITFVSGCQEFGYYDAVQTFTVPDNTTSVKIQVWGAEGGGYNESVPTCYGGNGGYAEGNLSVTEGQSLYFYVGGQGYEYSEGYNGGGGSSTSPRAGGGGTDVRTSMGSLTCNTGTDPRVIVAGGGGGGINTDVASSLGGGGGGTTGVVGDDSDCTGGTQSTGGTTIYGGASAGICGAGGDSPDGAGGGGWYGGGGASFGCGGSGYTGGVTDGVMEASYKTGNGFARVCWGISTACDGTHTAVVEDSECIPPEDEPARVPSSGLKLWLDANDLSTITKDGSNKVSAWNDKSGNGNHVTQTTSSFQPEYVASSNINDHPAMRFDGSLTYFNLSSFTSPATHTKFIVFKSSSSGIQRIWFRSRVGEVFILNTGTLSIDNGATVNNSNYTHQAITIGSLVFNSTSSEVYVNGSNVETGNSGTNSSTSNVTIGQGSGTYYYSGDIAEILVYDRVLSTVERQAVEAYLIDKYAIPTQDLELWLDALDESTITKDGSNLVSQWNDKSGNGKHVVQTTGANKPKYGTNLINGLPAVYCDSTTQQMTNTAGIPIAGDLTIFAVLQDTRNASNVQIVVNGGVGEGEATNWTYSWRFQSLVPQLFYETGGGSNVFADATTAVPSDDIVAYLTRDSNGTSSIDFGYLQDATDFSENDTAVNSSGGSDSDFFLFSGFTGKLGELLIYDRILTAEEIADVKAYLKNKWGI
jgi:prepilin-type N-terminal cleavage/methylation domain-containing protein